MRIFIPLVLFALLILVSAPANADTILSVGFENSAGFNVGGGYAQLWTYWGIAPLSGTASVPSNFVQGGGQSGNIFYGSYAKAYQGAPAATMTISLPDLSGYTNLQLIVALAAPDGTRWENTHRDSLHIIGGTSISPLIVDCSIAAGCLPVTGAIDSFLPAGYGAPLHSQFYSIDLHPQFQDFQYNIDGGLKSLTFAFASTDYDEVIGIDSVRITGDPTTPIPEPSTLALLGIGIAGLITFGKRRKS